MKVKSEGKWKSIPMSHNFFSGDLEQAVCGGIEELTDYTLVVKGKKSGKALKRELSAKKNSLLYPEASNGELGHNEEPSTKKSKKNVFNVTDIGPPELPVMKDDENTKKKVKAKKKKKNEKPAIDLSVFGKLVAQADGKVAKEGLKNTIISSSNKKEETDKNNKFLK